MAGLHSLGVTAGRRRVIELTGHRLANEVGRGRCGWLTEDRLHF
jgi:hypothetical protein